MVDVGQPRSSNRSDCFLCGQIAGIAEQDLLARMLPSLPYRRRVILENEAFAVIPSLGPLTSGHVLLCPKNHAPSFALLGDGGWGDGLEDAYSAIKGELMCLLAHHYGAEIHVFEHGMAAGGTHVPCTVDHAHLHFVPVHSFINVIVSGNLTWTGRNGSLAELAVRTRGQEYLFHEAPDGVWRVCTSPPGGFESQAMRRLFAAQLGCSERWNWREDPKPVIVDQVWKTLSSLSGCP